MRAVGLSEQRWMALLGTELMRAVLGLLISGDFLNTPVG